MDKSNVSDIKRFMKLSVCSFFYHSGLLCLYIKCVFSRRKSFPAVIINYHSFVDSLDDVLETSSTVTHLRSDFKEEVGFLKKYFDIVPLDHIVDTLKQNKAFQKPTVAITIDDGLKNNFDVLFPIVKEHNIPVTIFLATGTLSTNKKIWVDRLGWFILKTKKTSVAIDGLFQGKVFSLNTIHDRRQTYDTIAQYLKDVPINERDVYLKKIEEALGPVDESQRIMMNWNEIREMQKNRVFFGAHTANHPILTNMPLEDATREILDSKKKIEGELGVKVRHFAYPNGRPEDFNEELRRYCAQVGFDSVCTCDYGNNSKATDVLALKRIGSEVPISLFVVNVLRSFLRKR